MKTRLFSFLTILFFMFSAHFAFSLGSPERANEERLNTVVVYAYDSFTAEWGPGPELVRLFEEKTDYRVELVSCGDAGQVLSRAILEKNKPGADVLVGIDNNLEPMARKSGILKAFKPANASAIDENVSLASDWLLTPYDWGYFAFIYDTASKTPEPKSLADLTKPEYEKKIILMDPRTSTPGTGFLAWTLSVFGNEYLSYWASLKKNILTMASGWDTGYGLFTAGEAPLVISYTTSPAYHVEFENTNRYKALIFPEGHIAQIEGMGLAKGAINEQGAKAFIEFMLTNEAQAVLPLTQFMYPVSKTVTLPASYEAAPKAGKILAVNAKDIQNAVTEVTALLAK